MNDQQINLPALWVYENPHLAQQAIDELFAQWGNSADYRMLGYSENTFHLVIDRLPSGERKPMDEVIELKAVVQDYIHARAAAFMNDYRARYGNEWLMQHVEARRNEGLKQLEEMQT